MTIMLDIQIDNDINITIDIIINMNEQYGYPQVLLAASSKTFVLFCLHMPF